MPVGLFDTRVEGNSHRGHTGARHGTTLPDEEKRALHDLGTSLGIRAGSAGAFQPLPQQADRGQGELVGQCHLAYLGPHGVRTGPDPQRTEGCLSR